MNCHDICKRSNTTVASSGAWYLDSPPNVGRVRGLHFVKLSVFVFFAPCCEVCYGYRSKTMFISSLLPLDL